MKKIFFSKHLLKGCIALILGAVLMGVIVMGLGVYAQYEDPAPATTAALNETAVDFPETTQTLQILTMDMLGQTAPQDISPAAGDEEAETPTKDRTANNN